MTSAPRAEMGVQELSNFAGDVDKAGGGSKSQKLLWTSYMYVPYVEISQSRVFLLSCSIPFGLLLLLHDGMKIQNSAFWLNGQHFLFWCRTEQIICFD